MNPATLHTETLFEGKEGWTILELVGYLSHRDASVAMGGAADFSVGGSLAGLLRVCECDVRAHGLSHFYVYNDEPDYWLGWRVPFGEAANSKLSDGGPLTHELKQDANTPFAGARGQASRTTKRQTL